MNRLIKVLVLFFLTFCFSYANKIVTIGGSITETVVALGHEDKIIGVDLSSSYPKNLISKLPNVGYWLRLPQEGIISLKPDMVLTSNKAKPKKVIDSLSDFGIKTHIIDDEPSIESAKKKIRQVGEILNEKEKAQKIIQRIENNIEQIQTQLAKVKKKPKVLFVFSRKKGSMLAAGIDTKPGVMIKLAKADMAVNFKQYSKISSESILQMNPDVIIFTNHQKKGLLKNSIIKQTNAGKNGQIYEMDMLLLAGFTVRIDKALTDLSCKVHNNLFSFCK